MRCHIWGTNNHEDRTREGKGVACFAIPDWGLQFRAAQNGTAMLCEYAAMLALLKFLENNPKVFEGQKLEVLSDSSCLVEQLQGRLPVEPPQLKAWTLIRAVREKIHFELYWVPPDQNQAIVGVLDLPPLNTKFQIQHAPGPVKSPNPPPRRFNS